MSFIGGVTESSLTAKNAAESSINNTGKIIKKFLTRKRNFDVKSTWSSIDH